MKLYYIYIPLLWSYNDSLFSVFYENLASLLPRGDHPVVQAAALTHTKTRTQRSQTPGARSCTARALMRECASSAVCTELRLRRKGGGGTAALSSHNHITIITISFSRNTNFYRGYVARSSDASVKADSNLVNIWSPLNEFSLTLSQ